VIEVLSPSAQRLLAVSNGHGAVSVDLLFSIAAKHCKANHATNIA
jgi:hypothetical protein